MYIGELASKLKEYLPDIYVQLKYDVNILKVKLMIKDQSEFDSNTLYVGNLSIFQSFSPFPAGLSAVVFIDIGEGDMNLHSYDCNTISFGDAYSLYKVFNKIQDILLDTNKLLNSSASLLECLIKGKELRDIIETGFDIIRNPVMLMDNSYKVLAYKTDAEVNDPVWEDLIEHGYSSYKFVSLFKDEKIIEKILRNNEPILLDTGVAEKIRRILGKIMLKGKCAGYVAVLEYNRNFSSEDIRVVNLLCEVISSVMSTGTLLKNARGMMFENIIYDLLEGKIKNEVELNGRLRSCEWSPWSNMYCLAIDISRYNDPSFVDYFRDILYKLFAGSKSVFYNDVIVIIVDAGINNLSQSEALVKLTEFLRENDFLAGISHAFDDLINLGNYYKQAIKALQFGKEDPCGERLFKYGDYVIADFLCESSKHIDIKNYCHRGVLFLKEFDIDNNTDYYTTLYEYLKNDKNVISTAEALFIHRNTVHYRIERIEELLGFKFRECSETLQLLLTFKILETEKFRK